MYERCVWAKTIEYGERRGTELWKVDIGAFIHKMESMEDRIYCETDNKAAKREEFMKDIKKRSWKRARNFSSEANSIKKSKEQKY